MTLSLLQSQILNQLAGLLYNFLPGSGNNNFSFPIAAAEARVTEFWIPGSKRPAILRLLEDTFSQRRHRFCPLIQVIVRLSMGWRSGKEAPLSVAEIDQLTALLLQLEFKIPELHEARFREALSGAPTQVTQGNAIIDFQKIEALSRDLIAIAQLDPAPRGYAFEKFLTDAFALFSLAPRGSFRLVGEQIDGSFHLNTETYLLEARWQGPKVGNRELQAFAGVVRTKSNWSRGLLSAIPVFLTMALRHLPTVRQPRLFAWTVTSWGRCWRTSWLCQMF